MKVQRKNDLKKIRTMGVICLISFALMTLAQIPTPQYLNPVGCIFATIWICSGIGFAMFGTYFWLDS